MHVVVGKQQLVRFMLEPLGAVFARGNEVKWLLAALGVVLVALGLFLGCSSPSLGDLGSVLGGLEAILGLSWGAFGRS